MDPNNSISGSVEAISFNDTLGKIKMAIEGGLSENQTISANSVEIYEVIKDFGQMVRAGQTAHISTKYKTVDRKVRPVATPLPEDSWERMNGVAIDPCGIGHRFTDEPLQKLKIGGDSFLLPIDTNLFPEDARKSREGFCILSGGDRVCRSNHRRTYGDIHGTACTVEP